MADSENPMRDIRVEQLSCSQGSGESRGVQKSMGKKVWLSPERNFGDWFLWHGRKSGRRIGRNFLRIFVLHLLCRMATNVLPKFLPIYHSMSCSWNFKISSPQASGFGGRNMSIKCSIEDWEADLSPCNFATAHFPAERSGFNFL